MGRKITERTLKKQEQLEQEKREAAQATFLKTLSLSCNVTLSAQGAGVSRTAVYEWRDKYPDFAAAWENAIQEAIERLEYEAWQRARKQSDTLMIFLLKAHKPEKYRETVRQELTGKDGEALTLPIVFLPQVNDDNERTD